MTTSTMTFRQLFDAQSSTYTYLLGDAASGEAVLIDPVLEQVRRDLGIVRDLGLKLVATIDTHVHADHVTGAAALRQRTHAQVLVAKAANAQGADRLLEDGDTVPFGAHHLRVMSTPGHTAGCITLVTDDGHMAFTGDCLLIRGTGRTDFQGGSAEQLFDSAHRRIFSLADDCLLYPGHDYRGLTVSSVAEEKRCNPRVGGAIDVGDFTGHMRHLNLPHPKLIDLAVPANLRCGAVETLAAFTSDPDWAPLDYSVTGVWEVAPEWLEAHPGAAQVIDVREAEEFSGPMGHVPGARLIPLAQLSDRIAELDRARPVVAVCRSGSRSAQACVLLVKAGFERVANLAGGMLRWRGQGYRVEGGAA